MTFKLAHISDPHLGPLPNVKRRELISKRITGYINWQRSRGKQLESIFLQDLISHINTHQVDHLAVTGDLVNLALPEELLTAQAWLEQLGDAADVSVAPGNHDTYVPGALRKIQDLWGEYMRGDNDTKCQFPYFRRRGNLALIGVNSGRASLPFMATGAFTNYQARRLERLLTEAKSAGLFCVVMIHHPPFAGATRVHKRLVGAARFRAVVKKCGANLILHGHTHIISRQLIDGLDHQVPVIGVPAASQKPLISNNNAKQSKTPGRYNLFLISGTAGNWNCEMEEYGFKDGKVSCLSSRSVFKNSVVQNLD